MIQRTTMIATACLALTSLATGEAMAQSAPAAPSGVIVQSAEDSAEAEQADRDRREAERIDRRRRGVPMVPEDSENEAWRREAYRDWSACVARLSEEKAVVVEQLRAGTELSIQSIRDSAGDGNVAVAVEEQRRQRDQLIEAVLGGYCP